MIIDYLYTIRNFTSGTNHNLIIIFYEGEPLLNMILVKEIITYTRKLFPFKVKFSMTTSNNLQNENVRKIINKS